MLQDLPLCSKLTFTSALCQTHLDDWLDDTLSPGTKASHPKASHSCSQDTALLPNRFLESRRKQGLAQDFALASTLGMATFSPLQREPHPEPATRRCPYCHHPPAWHLWGCWWHPGMMLLPPVSPQILEGFGTLPALLLSPYPELYSSSREGRGPGKAEASTPHAEDSPKHPQSCLTPSMYPEQSRQEQPRTGTNYPADSNLQLHLILICGWATRVALPPFPPAIPPSSRDRLLCTELLMPHFKRQN